MEYLSRDDPELSGLICREEDRLETTLDLIAAENLPPPSIMEALGSVFTVKTAEGYPGSRFHAGCKIADKVEALAADRAKTLFAAEYANVQPHSGTSANLAVYFAALSLGDRVLAMGLAHGGHLSHGHPSSITGRCFEFAHYPVNPETERIDYDQVREMAGEFGPKMIVAGASAYPRLIDYEKMADIAASAGALFMVDMAHIAGLVAAESIPSPVPHSDFVTFTCYKTLMGGRGGVILARERFGKQLDKAVFPGTQGTTPVNTLAAKALCFRLAATPGFKKIQQRTLDDAKQLAASLEEKGYRIVTGGTENHQVILDVAGRGISGAEAETTLESVGILANRNAIPSDADHPLRASGLRLGTAAASSRGMGPREMVRVATLIDAALGSRDKPEVLSRVAEQVRSLCEEFPVYQRSDSCLMGAFS